MLCMIIKPVLIWLLALYVFFVGIQFWMQNKNYNFSAKMVEEIALKHKDKELAKAFDDIYKEFSTRFAGHILPESDRKWLFMNAGGWMGGIQIMHASITEYLLFFGTGVNTSGNSGRYWANISDTILTGSFRQWKEGGFHSEVFGPGETVHHYWGEVSAVQWDAGTWMVEYGRGFIPSTLFFALADTFTSTLDFLTLYHTILLYGKSLTLEAQMCMTEMFG